MSAGRRNEALDKYKSCVKGTEEMARVVCAAVEKEFGKDGKLGVGKKWGVGRVKCVFSPYEADAQLAKLCADGYCHGVVTEVSEVWGGLFRFHCVDVGISLLNPINYFLVCRIRMCLCTLQLAVGLFRVSK